MPLLPFWALSVVVVLLSMEDQRALGFHQKYLHLCSDDNEGLTGLERHEVVLMTECLFWANCPFKIFSEFH